MGQARNLSWGTPRWIKSKIAKADAASLAFVIIDGSTRPNDATLLAPVGASSSVRVIIAESIANGSVIEFEFRDLATGARKGGWIFPVPGRGADSVDSLTTLLGNVLCPPLKPESKPGRKPQANDEVIWKARLEGKTIEEISDTEGVGLANTASLRQRLRRQRKGATNRKIDL